MLDPGIVGIIAAISSPFIAGGFGFLGIWFAKRSERKQAADAANGTNALSWQDRLAAIEKRADDREAAAKKELGAMQKKLDDVEEELRSFFDMWRIVTGTIAQVLWDIARQWPHGADRPILEPYLIEVLERYKLADLIPAAFRGAPVDKD